MKPDDDWDTLIEEMWKYQWIKEKVPLSEELKNTIYHESQGIVDVAVKLFSLAQSRSIEQGYETITSRLIETVTNEDLQFIQPMLKALKRGILSEIQQYEDIVPLNLSKFLEERKSKIDLRAALQKKKEEQEKKRKEFEISLVEKVISALITLGTPAKEVEKAVSKIMRETKEDDLHVVLNKSLDYLKQKEIKDRQKMEQRMTSTTTNYLQEIIEKGKKNNISAYDSLLNAGYIKLPVNEFDL